MDFSRALRHLKDGTRIRRKRWLHPGMWLILVPGSTITVDADRPLGRAVPSLVGREVLYMPHIDLRNEYGELAPWNPTHIDLLADDWETV